MTALNYVFTPSRSFVIQDSAVLRDERVVEFRPKPIDFPQMRGVIASAGPASLCSVMHKLIGAEFESIDHLAALGEEFFMDVRTTWNAMLVDAGWPPDIAQRTVVAGWSEVFDRPRCVIFHDSIDVVFDVDPEELISPMIEREPLIAYFKRLIATGGRDSFDPADHGIEMIEAQRWTKTAATPQGEPGYTVGGFIEVCEIHREGVDRRIIHRWPEDKVGQPLRPRAAPEPPPPGLSRQQRRAWEAKRRAWEAKRRKG